MHGPTLYAEVLAPSDDRSVSFDHLTLRLSNKTARTIQLWDLHGLPWGTNLQPSNAIEVRTHGEHSGYIGGLDVSQGSVRMDIEILAGKPEGARVRILGHYSPYMP